MSSEDNKQKEGGFFKGIVQFFITVLIIISAAFLLRTFVFQSYEIPSGSMEDTIMTGDFVFAEKLSTYFESPKPGQIVTFDDPEVASRILIKRVIATEGQTIDLKDGFVYIDGQKQDEPYTLGKPSYPLTNAPGVSITYPYTIPAGHIWLMGDNRTASQDSRYFGAIPVKTVLGHALFVYWPPVNMGPI